MQAFDCSSGVVDSIYSTDRVHIDNGETVDSRHLFERCDVIGQDPADCIGHRTIVSPVSTRWGDEHDSKLLVDPGRLFDEGSGVAVEGILPAYGAFDVEIAHGAQRGVSAEIIGNKVNQKPGKIGEITSCKAG